MPTVVLTILPKKVKFFVLSVADLDVSLFELILIVFVFCANIDVEREMNSHCASPFVPPPHGTQLSHDHARI